MSDNLSQGPVLDVRGLTIRFVTERATVLAVNDISFVIDAGERVAIVGESGCGKTATSLAIMRLLPEPAGEIVGGAILFEGINLLQLPEARMREVRGDGLAMIFQDPMTSLNPVLTIGDQMVEGIRAHRDVSKRAARDLAAELLGKVGIPNPRSQLKNYPHQLSGGMKQRIMIAAALASRQKLIIADEPTTALDVTIQAQVLELLYDVTTEANTALILITHDLGVVARMAQRVNVMYAGFIVEAASTPELFASPRHPYTVGLLHSIPRLDSDRGQQLLPIEGQPPDLRSAPAGCPFAPRCGWALDVCREQMPSLLEVDLGPTAHPSREGASHVVACHNQPSGAEVLAGRPLREMPSESDTKQPRSFTS